MTKTELKLIEQIMGYNGYPNVISEVKDRTEFWDSDYEDSIVVTNRSVFVEVVQKLIGKKLETAKWFARHELQSKIKELLNIE